MKRVGGTGLLQGLESLFGSPGGRQTLVPSERTVSWVGLLKVLLLLTSMLMVVKQK